MLGLIPRTLRVKVMQLSLAVISFIEVESLLIDLHAN